ncbi:hypothetical protein BX666DRAFT_1971484 [Dichotomocladium elegans]|nr:hypothetical protein BX666DRAFT_1971484 [Dichotomocladium elegans]
MPVSHRPPTALLASAPSPDAISLGANTPTTAKTSSMSTKRHTCTEPGCGRRFNQLERLKAHMR